MLAHLTLLRSTVTCGAYLLLGSAVLWGQAAEVRPVSAADALRSAAEPFVAEHCAACHNREFRTVGLDLVTLVGGTTQAESTELWLRVLDKLRSGQMPPPGRPRPAEADIDHVTSSIVTFLDAGASRLNAPRRVTARRLNRVEYRNTVRSLLGVAGDWSETFPLDDAGYGFDNNGDVLSLSPLLMEKYLAAAREISRLAVFGTPVPENPRVLARYLGRRSHDANDDLDGAGALPYSMRGALYGSHVFQWDAEYELRFRVANYRRSRRQLIADGIIQPNDRDRAQRQADIALSEPERRARFLEDARDSQPPMPVVATINGTVVHEEMIEGSNAFGYERGELATRLRIPAGEHAFRISYPDTANLDDPRDNLLADGRRVLYVDYLDIVGPFDPAPAPPSSYERLFLCRHSPGRHTEHCAGDIVTNLAQRAYRRPITRTELEPILGLVRQAQASGDTLEDGIQLAVQAILISPHFLFRLEADPRTSEVTGRSAGDSEPTRLLSHELATRLSYFLWADMPDGELFEAAATQRLGDADVLRQQTIRMLADDRSASLVDDFAAQWLQLRGLERVKPDPMYFPTVDDELVDAMQTETALFLSALIRDDGNMLDLLDAPFTFLNGPLARHYGLPGVDGESFRRVSLSGSQRGGLLSQASVLMVSSYPTRTSPVLRGKWILENLLGTPPADPPPDVPALAVDTIAATSKNVPSLREQMERHRTNPSCAVCHDAIDPLGFGLEKYDATGAWRTHEGDTAINDHGVLPDGTSFRGPQELKHVLRLRADQFRRNLAERLLTYALGRGLEAYDAEAIDGIVARAAAADDRWSAYVLGVVESAPFRTRQHEGTSNGVL